MRFECDICGDVKKTTRLRLCHIGDITDYNFICDDCLPIQEKVGIVEDAKVNIGDI